MKVRNISNKFKDFHDDLEKDLGFEMNELDYDDYEQTNSIIKKYLINNFKIYSNETELELDFLGYERKMTWLFII